MCLNLWSHDINTVWRIGKIFGLFPINFKSRNPQEMKFEWVSLRTTISLAFIFSAFISVVYEMNYRLYIVGGAMTIGKVAGIIFYFNCLLGYVFLFRLARHFSNIFTVWMRTELRMYNAFEPSTERWSQRKKITAFASFYITAATLEHMLAISSEIYIIAYDFKICEPTNADLFATFVNRRVTFFVESMPFTYNNFLGFILEYMNVAMTITWSFIDLTIIIFSLGMSLLFEQLNRRMESLRHVIADEIVWCELREDYEKVCELLNMLNVHMGALVICACSFDGFFVLFQLLNIMKWENLTIPCWINYSFTNWYIAFYRWQTPAIHCEQYLFLAVDAVPPLPNVSCHPIGRIHEGKGEISVEIFSNYSYASVE